MSKNIIIAVLIATTIISFFIGKNKYPKQVLISEYIEQCENATGEFKVYKDYTGKYYKFYCDIPSKRIFDYTFEYQK